MCFGVTGMTDIKDPVRDGACSSAPPGTESLLFLYSLKFAHLSPQLHPILLHIQPLRHILNPDPPVGCDRDQNSVFAVALNVGDDRVDDVGLFDGPVRDLPVLLFIGVQVQIEHPAVCPALRAERPVDGDAVRQLPGLFRRDEGEGLP